MSIFEHYYLTENDSHIRWTRVERLPHELAVRSVQKYVEDPERVTRIALDNLTRIRKHVTGTLGVAWLDEWERMIVEGDVEALRSVSTARTSFGVDMRQNMPFAGVLTQQERLEALAAASDSTVEELTKRLDTVGRKLAEGI